jgi:hypothetical protein
MTLSFIILTAILLVLSDPVSAAIALCAPGVTCVDGTCEQGRCNSPATRCVDPSRTVMEAINATYKTSRVTTRSIDMAGKKLLMDDFSTNVANNLAYQFACTDKGANYVELRYDAECKNAAGNKTVSLYVINQPRCYAKTCLDNDGSRAFNDLTLRPTESRASRDSNPAEVWKCTGQLRNSSWNFCMVMTDPINQKNDMRVASFDIKPTVTTQKFLGVFDKKEQLVTFPAADQNFKDTCERNGGVVRVVKQPGIVCGKSTFKIQDFTTCLWPLCGPNTDRDTSVVIMQQFQAKLKVEKIKVSGTCVFSSAVRLCVGSVVFAVIGVSTFVFSVM